MDIPSIKGTKRKRERQEDPVIKRLKTESLDYYFDQLYNVCKNIDEVSFQKLPNIFNFKEEGDEYSLISTFQNKSLPFKVRIDAKRKLDEILLNLLLKGLFKNNDLINFIRSNFMLLTDQLEYVEKSYLVPKYHNIFFTIINGIISKNYLLKQPYQVDLSKDEFFPLLYEKIHNWFSLANEQLVGKESVEGEVISLQNTFSNEIVLVKSSLNKNDLKHDAIVGMCALNSLKVFIPNFMYIYGYTECTPIISDVKDSLREVLNWCSSEHESHSYVFLERITNSESFFNFLSKANLEFFIPVFLQIIGALNLAFTKVGFVHYDLHLNNILVRTYSENGRLGKIAIPFYYKEQKFYVITENIPYIIDYGYSRIKITYNLEEKKELDYYRVDLVEKGIIPEQAFPMRDYYKIICSSAKRTKDKEVFNFLNTCYELLFELAKRKNIKVTYETLEDRIKRKTDDDYFIAPIEFQSLSPDEFITKLLDIKLRNNNKLKDVLVREVGERIEYPLSTRDDVCDLLKLMSQKHKLTPLEFCQAIEGVRNLPLDERTKQSLQTIIKNNFDVLEYFNNHWGEYLKNVENALSILKDPIYFYLLKRDVLTVKNYVFGFEESQVDLIKILNSNVLMDAFVEFFKRVIRANDSIRSAYFFARSCQCAENVIGSKRISYVDYFNSLEKLVSSFKNYAKIIAINANYVKSYKKKLLKDIIKTNLSQNLSFYKKELEVFFNNKFFSKIVNFIEDVDNHEYKDLVSLIKNTSYDNINAVIKYYNNRLQKIKIDGEILKKTFTIDELRDILNQTNRNLSSLTDQDEIRLSRSIISMAEVCLLLKRFYNIISNFGRLKSLREIKLQEYLAVNLEELQDFSIFIEQEILDLEKRIIIAIQEKDSSFEKEKFRKYRIYYEVIEFFEEFKNLKRCYRLWFKQLLRINKILYK